MARGCLGGKAFPAKGNARAKAPDAEIYESEMR